MFFSARAANPCTKGFYVILPLSLILWYVLGLAEESDPDKQNIEIFFFDRWWEIALILTSGLAIYRKRYWEFAVGPAGYFIVFARTVVANGILELGLLIPMLIEHWLTGDLMYFEMFEKQKDRFAIDFFFLLFAICLLNDYWRNGYLTKYEFPFKKNLGSN